MQLPRSEVSLASNVHWVDCTYHGPGPALAQALVAISHGGQTVCNEMAWKALQDNLPGRCQVRALVAVYACCGAADVLLLLVFCC